MNKHLITGPFIKRTGQDFASGPVVKGLPANAVDTGSISGLGIFTCQGATQAEQIQIIEFQRAVLLFSSPLLGGQMQQTPLLLQR